MLSAAEFLIHEEGLHRPIEQRYYISHRECNASRRCVLINWMSEVIVYHGMHRETFHLAISLLDRFVEQTNVPKQKLQLYGAACILVSGKLKVFISITNPIRKFTHLKFPITAPYATGSTQNGKCVMPNLIFYL